MFLSKMLITNSKEWIILQWKIESAQSDYAIKTDKKKIVAPFQVC